MDMQMSIKLLKKYSDCPVCGNDKVGNGYGRLDVDDDMFFRSCKCGYSIKIKALNRIKYEVVEEIKPE